MYNCDSHLNEEMFLPLQGHVELRRRPYSFYLHPDRFDANCDRLPWRYPLQQSPAGNCPLTLRCEHNVSGTALL